MISGTLPAGKHLGVPNHLSIAAARTVYVTGSIRTTSTVGGDGDPAGNISIHGAFTGR